MICEKLRNIGIHLQACPVQPLTNGWKELMKVLVLVGIIPFMHGLVALEILKILCLPMLHCTNRLVCFVKKISELNVNFQGFYVVLYRVS